MINNLKKETWIERIVNALMEQKTFDVTVNTGGYSTYTQMIARSLLDGYSEKGLIDNFETYHDMVKKNINHAINHIRTVLRVPVYISKSPGGKFNEYITINKDYRDAVNDEIKRIQTNLKRGIGSAKQQFELAAPRRDFGLIVNRELELLN